jgi:hypothetical protein
MQVLRKVLLAATVLMIGLGPIGRGVAFADDRVTVMLRSGEKLSGRFDGVANGRFYLDISDTDERHIPMGDIVVIDLTQGASNLPETELGPARGGSHVLVMKNGDLAKGNLDRIDGSRIDGDRDVATVRFRAEGGGDRNVPMRDVARIYLGHYPGAAPSSPSQPQTPSTPNQSGGQSGGGQSGGRNSGGDRVITLPANTQWMDTGLTVRQGQQLTISASGQATLSANGNDKANPNGSLNGRRAQNSPLPQELAGALIGRIGNGRPFGIGSGPINIAAPGSGQLYIGINDDGMDDNSGQFEVRISGAGTGSQNGRGNRNSSDDNNNRDNTGRRRRRP